jgi:citronellol/citronellal dehydrogenase
LGGEGVGLELGLKARTAIVCGASSGMGLATAEALAREGANVSMFARRRDVLDLEAERLGALAVRGDVTNPADLKRLVERTVAAFGGIDILVNNASAISLTGTEHTPMKRYDLMQQINTRGTFVCSQACIPLLKQAQNPHILNISPPLNMEERWFAPHVAYTMAKFGMSMCVLGMAGELRRDGIAVNALWPRTTIATAAIQNLLGGEAAMRGSRKPSIMGDAAHAILTKPSREFTGKFCIDDDVLAADGKSDLSEYAMDPNAKLLPDYFI